MDCNIKQEGISKLKIIKIVLYMTKLILRENMHEINHNKSLTSFLQLIFTSIEN